MKRKQRSFKAHVAELHTLAEKDGVNFPDLLDLLLAQHRCPVLLAHLVGGPESTEAMLKDYRKAWLKAGAKASGVGRGKRRTTTRVKTMRHENAKYVQRTRAFFRRTRKTHRDILKPL